jgi:hypothetical protein
MTPPAGAQGRTFTLPRRFHNERKPKTLYSDPFGQSIVCANKHQNKSEITLPARTAAAPTPERGWGVRTRAAHAIYRGLT